MSLLRASLFFKRKFSASLPSILPANSNLYNTNFQRTHLMGELSESLLQKQVTLCGWVSTIRNVSKNLFFLLLRDHSGTVQLTLTRTHIAEETFLALQEAVEKRKVTPEAVIAVRGIVQPRPIGMNNSAMTNGSIEIFVQDFRILNTIQNQTSSSKQLPFTLNDKYLPTEDVRLQDRFLDLRRDDMQKVIRFRAKVNRSIRSFFDSQGFVEIETPILFKSSPEGAKEFLVPHQSGLNYALPQSPQQCKQLLMVAGFDKYYQIAKCFRDEGMRSDRQPEFTQLDMEMSFVSQEQVMQTMESLIKHLWKSHKAEYASDTDNSVLITDSPFERISYDEAMRLYGSDKPDLRFQGKIAFSMTVTGDPTTNHVLEGLLLKGRGRSSHNRDESNAFCLPIEGLKSKEILRTFSQGHSDGTLAKWHGNDLTKCPFVSKHETDAILNRLEDELGLNVGPRDCLLVQKRDVNANVGLTCLGRARLAALQTLLAEGNCETGEADKFLWVHSFPLLTRASPESCAQNPLRRFDSMHHPFTAPLDDHALTDTTNDSQLLQLRAQHYDLVLNGQEIGGGSVRIHDANFQEFLMSSILGLSPQQIGHFTHLLRALKLGAPPHAGMALGLDRIVAILAKKQSIREVIAFPKNSTGFDLCFKAPS